jgi:hypothetical protein
MLDVGSWMFNPNPEALEGHFKLSTLNFQLSTWLFFHPEALEGLDVGCWKFWMLDVGCWMFWMMDVGCFGCWMLDVGCWMMDVG